MQTVLYWFFSFAEKKDPLPKIGGSYKKISVVCMYVPIYVHDLQVTVYLRFSSSLAFLNRLVTGKKHFFGFVKIRNLTFLKIKNLLFMTILCSFPTFSTLRSPNLVCRPLTTI